ncbi:MAG: anti-sigma factor [Actinomycetota bacterium]|nr:anti-sigma factor [Actinomycetota bacterium]
MTATDVHTRAGPFALHALPGDEATEFEGHLDVCATCRQEVDEYVDTAALLGRSAAEQPPARLRQKVLAAIRTTRQLPPLLTTPPDTARTRRRWPQLLAVAAAVLAVGAGGVAVGTALGDDPAADVIAAVDARTSTGKLRGGGSMTMISSAEHGKAVIVTENLPMLAEDRIYQLWWIDETGTVRSADVLIDPAEPGVHLVPMPEPDVRVGITREPAGGSQTPSMSPLTVVGAA